MSYILEALRKADAERERGAVPDIHTQPLIASDRDDVPARTRWLIPALLAGALLVLAALAAVLLRGRGDAPVVTARAPAAPQPGAGAPPVAPPPPAPIVPISPAVNPAPPAPSAAPPPPAPAPRTAPAAPRKVTEAAPARRSDKRETTPDKAAGASQEGGRVYAINELPDEVRRQLPNFAFGGSVYSDTPANRMLIINGQLFNEGGQPAPDVVLDQIRLKSAVFRYRGYRYETPY